MLPRTAWCAITVCLGGCSLPEQRADFNSVDPQERTLATLKAAETGDRAAIPQLIQQLASDDPALRMLAIRTLERLTGQTLGYEHAAPEPQRREAIVRWRDWQRAADSQGNPPVSGSVQTRVGQGS
jgi:hypothetical protein